MEGRERAELKNEVLRFLLENNGDHRPKSIYRSLKRPVKSIEHFIEVLQEMHQDGSKYFYYEAKEDGRIWVLKQNDFTQEFLDAGGFVNQYESELEADREEARLEEEARRKRKWEGYKLRFWWAPIGISLIGVALAVAAYLRPVQGPSQDQIDALDSKIEELKSEFQKENEELKERLYEAEMLIAVYESEKK